MDNPQNQGGEEQKPDEGTEQKPDEGTEKETEEGTEQKPEEGAGETKPEGDVDYEAELKKTREERNQFLQGLKNEKDKHKKTKEELENTSKAEADLEDIDKKIEERLQEQLSQQQQQMAKDLIDDEISTNARNDSEAELIREHYNNTITKSGYSRSAIQKDIRRAKLLANETRYESDMENMRATLDSERAKSRAGGSQSAKRELDEVDDTQVKLSDADMRVINRIAQRRGISVDAAKQEFIKNNQ